MTEQPSRIRFRRADLPKAGFTLIELMVVILIISIMFGIVLTAVTGNDPGRSLDAGVAQISGAFGLARTAAITRKTPVRVLVNFDPGQPDRFLKQYMLVFLNDDGEWEAYSNLESLPQGVFFSPALSTSNEGSASPLYTWELPVDGNLNVDNAGASPTLTPRNAYGLSGNRDPLSHGPAANRWYAYEFNANGTARHPGIRMVLAAGIGSASPPGLVVPERTMADGFVVFRAGRPLHFQAPQQILEGN